MAKGMELAGGALWGGRRRGGGRGRSTRLWQCSAGLGEPNGRAPTRTNRPASQDLHVTSMASQPSRGPPPVGSMALLPGDGGRAASRNSGRATAGRRWRAALARENAKRGEYFG
ncbi:hypothetical protein PVAP13_2KG432016 [Panicum virgatum]|uniref:Uncharacterized protein n=1 Tax=Panicum virgatum TaxID=38727 RepID=A0A8T0W8F3_PANVG|nr:hypothetical protein PVAP13_2KG432016 [Panicum virgatum]